MHSALTVALPFLKIAAFFIKNADIFSVYFLSYKDLPLQNKLVKENLAIFKQWVISSNIATWAIMQHEHLSKLLRIIIGEW